MKSENVFMDNVLGLNKSVGNVLDLSKSAGQKYKWAAFD